MLMLRKEDFKKYLNQSAHPDVQKHISHFSFVVGRIQSEDIQSDHSQNENHLLPRLQLHHTICWRGAEELVSSCYLFQP